MLLAGLVPAVAAVLIGAKLARDHSRRVRDSEPEVHLSLVLSAVLEVACSWPGGARAG